MKYFHQIPFFHTTEFICAPSAIARPKSGQVWTQCTMNGRIPRCRVTAKLSPLDSDKKNARHFAKKNKKFLYSYIICKCLGVGLNSLAINYLNSAGLAEFISTFHPRNRFQRLPLTCFVAVRLRQVILPADFSGIGATILLSRCLSIISV